MPHTIEGMQRLAAVEVQIKGMDGVPERLAALEVQYRSLNDSLYREVDGLREQQKAHKDELKRQIEQRNTEVMDKIDALTEAVTAGRGGLRALVWAGGALGGGAVALGALWGVFKTLFHLN